MEWSEMPSLCIFLTATFMKLVLGDSLNIFNVQLAALTRSTLFPRLHRQYSQWSNSPNSPFPATCLRSKSLTSGLGWCIALGDN